MQSSLILTSFFCFTTWINLVQAINGSPNDCPCTAVSKIRIHHSNIENYTNQTAGTCLYSAIAFHTVKGKTICSNPNDEWAKHVIRQLEKRRNEKISTRGTPPQSTRMSTVGRWGSTSTSPPLSGPTSTSSPASLLGSEPTSDLTLAPSTKTSTSSTAPTSIPSSKTLTSVSTQSTPNPRSASTSLSNTVAGTSGTTSANDRIPSTSVKTRKASRRRHQRTKKQPKRRNMKKWQRKYTRKSKLLLSAKILLRNIPCNT